MPHHTGGSTQLQSGNAALSRYSTATDFLSGGGGGPRSLSDSSAAESPVGSEEVLQTNGGTGFHHHHVHHHHNSGTGYHSSHYPVLPASLLYSQLYSHSTGGSADLLANSRTDDVTSVTSAAQQRTQDVWRPY
ncbi:hypothetical protein LSTR_LSTR005707 [Laodelphax striatellus]|uniref:Uncharacterized protein n=1 Tax=Laodelphax striatellus TaxID=195883 RepID=A0A482XQB1_LAOST|nr:hypothetical protein LSTR_LSTR005707 [Laodelphax striatellus]